MFLKFLPRISITFSRFYLHLKMSFINEGTYSFNGNKTKEIHKNIQALTSSVQSAKKFQKSCIFSHVKH